ncbi:MAG: hypothetical protein CXT73_03400 [Methanobacteriota archaeon]|nr:MAG: hypothetical protein CXT73_03400 [Euryarchaeota archaeon]
MYASSEKKLIQKNYKENIYHADIWNYYKKDNYTIQTSLSWDSAYNQWKFVFPLNDCNKSYSIHFSYIEDAQSYINYIVNNYLT